MKLCRFEADGRAQYGIVEGDTVRSLGTDSFLDAEAAAANAASAAIPLAAVRLLAPLRPGKIIGVGRNYADHAKELGNEVPKDPLLFLKPPSSVIGPDGTIRMPQESERVDFEGELAVIIGEPARNVPAEAWRRYVFGFTCGNDVTARDLQKKDVQFTRAKGFDTFCPLGPWIDTTLDPSDLELITTVNGEEKQRGRTSQMIFDVPTLIAYISRIMTLEPGDVILTGTPSGVGPLQRGDEVVVTIESLGTLTSQVQ
jgi:2-keto-4-pentenoate hydratase/2-oxohepta-3-ene-1,7-dioic acid hydratase in catechol pathway